MIITDSWTGNFWYLILNFKTGPKRTGFFVLFPCSSKVERCTVNANVAGSSPAGGAK